MYETGRDGNNGNQSKLRNFGQTRVMERDERKILELDRQATGARTAQEEKKEFTPIRKNPRLTVTNPMQKQTVEIGKVAKKKQKVSAKNVVMMVAFSVVAVALSFVIAFNAITIGSLSATTAQLSAELSTLESTYTTLSAELSAVSNPERLSSIAESRLDLSAETPQTVGFSVPGYVEAEAPTFTNNWFDNILDSIS